MDLRETDALYLLISLALTKDGSKLVKMVADGEKMTPKDVRKMLAGVGVKLSEAKARPGQVRLRLFDRDEEKEHGGWQNDKW